MGYSPATNRNQVPFGSPSSTRTARAGWPAFFASFAASASARPRALKLPAWTTKTGSPFQSGVSNVPAFVCAAAPLGAGCAAGGGLGVTRGWGGA